MINKNFLDFIEIGTSDFDTEIQKKDSRIGISIDAVKFYLDRLPEKDNCLKLNMGVSNYNGKIKVNYLPLENIRKYNLPWWVRGCNSVNNYHPTVTKLLKKKGLKKEEVITSENIPCQTLNSILKDNSIKSFYYLKIDTEGHDHVILTHFFQNFANNRILPHKILLESNSLTEKSDVLNVIKLAKNIGYDLISNKGDTILKLNIKKVEDKNIDPNIIENYTIVNYPSNYDPKNLPHKNTFEGAKQYCIENNCSGITYKNGLYEVKNGKYIEYCKNSKLWIFV